MLQEMTVAVWDNQECKETYGNAAPGGIMPHMLCAGFKGKDSCSVSLDMNHTIKGAASSTSFR